jgi:hypothetical protein
MALNGIQYSFIKDAKLKERILQQVQNALTKFEQDMLAR